MEYTRKYLKFDNVSKIITLIIFENENYLQSFEKIMLFIIVL